MNRKRSRLVVIGNGMAGARFVEELLLRGGADRFEVVMFGDEPYGNYNRILLSAVLAGTHDPEDIFLNPLSWYQENEIRLHAGVRATRIDLDRRVVIGQGGIAEPYDKLVIATGSSPFIPPIEGARASGGGLRDGVLAFRTLEDCGLIAARAARARRAAVIGGGLLGLEAARGLLDLGPEVHVVHLMPHLMDLQLDPRGAAILRRSLEGMGVRVHLERNTTRILGDEAVEGLAFADGSQLACDLVVISAGIRPNTALARDAGLLVDRGIVVGDHLSVPDRRDVFAIGECAQHRGRTYGLVAPLWEQAAVLADVLSGKRPEARYTGSKVATKLKVMGIELTVMGARNPEHEDDEEVSYVEPSRGVYKKLIVRKNRVVGAILLGDVTAAPALLQAFDRGSPLASDRGAILFPGTVGGAAPPSIVDRPDDFQVCNCNGVSKGAIVAAIRAGHHTLKVLGERTRAGTGCGACKKDVERLLLAVRGEGPAEDPSTHYYVPGVPLAKPELVTAIRERGLRSVSAVFAALAEGREDAASKPGLASLLRTIWGADYEDERDARFINDRVQANIQKDGTFSVIPRIYGGVVTPAELRRIADVAERYEVKMVKITGGQRIDLLGVPKESLPEVWRALGMPSGHAYSKAFRTCKTCVGSEFCRYGVGDSTGLGIAIERRFQGLEAPAKLKLATAGCPRNCSEATTKDLGAVAIDGGRWEIYVGGGAGSRVRKGDLLATVDSHEEVLTLTGRFMQYYRERARYQERTYDFVERIGIERLRAILVQDAEGIAAALDAAMQDAVEAYVDPWSEADHPVNSTQFADSLGAVRRAVGA